MRATTSSPEKLELSIPMDASLACVPRRKLQYPPICLTRTMHSTIRKIVPIGREDCRGGTAPFFSAKVVSTWLFPVLSYPPQPSPAARPHSSPKYHYRLRRVFPRLGLSPSPTSSFASWLMSTPLSSAYKERTHAPATKRRGSYKNTPR